MSFSYQFGANPAIDYPRFLASDTVDQGHVFEDSEILMVTAIQQKTWQSAQQYSGSGGANLPSAPVSYRRIAATLLDAVAANKARLSSVTQLLDVTLSPEQAASSLREVAKCLREEDDAGAFVMIEQVQQPFGFRDRWWAQMQRQGAA